MFSLEFSHGLGVFETLAQRIHKDRIEPVDAASVLFEHGGGAGYSVSHAWSPIWGV